MVIFVGRPVWSFGESPQFKIAFYIRGFVLKNKCGNARKHSHFQQPFEFKWNCHFHYAYTRDENMKCGNASPPLHLFPPTTPLLVTDKKTFEAGSKTRPNVLQTTQEIRTLFCWCPQQSLVLYLQKVFKRYTLNEHTARQCLTLF